VADINGNYTFKNLLPGTYSVWAAFDDHNTNVPARVDRVYFTSEGALVTITAENQTADFAMISMGQSDAVAVNTIDGDWNQDHSHSNVDFEFPYDGENATYTGRFNAFEFGVNFDPANLAGSLLTASIDVLSVNTGSPGGRDALYTAEGAFWQDTDGSYDLGCISGTFGVSDPDDATRYATFESETIVVYVDGYLATGPMTFNGVTSNIQFFFKYFPGFQAENRAGVLTQFSSFEGYFEFAALDVFGIESSHVLDSNVTVRISDQVNKPI
jgi:polyisoprenoid-binding protein YceI